MSISRFALAALLVTLLAADTAVSGSGGSAYSVHGIGDLRYVSGPRSAAMGYTGIGVPGATHIHALSPATWSRIGRTRLEAVLLYEGFNSSDGTKSLTLARSDFGGALLALPIAPARGVVFVAGFTPYSRVNYNTFTRLTLQNIEYTIEHTGTGGLTRGQAGLSYAPATDLSLGVSLNYLVGTINAERVYVPASSSVSGGRVSESIAHRGTTVSLGGLFTGFGRISESLRPLALGVVATSRGTLTREREVFYEFTESRDTSALATGTQAIPFAFGVGAGYQAGERVMLAADYVTQPWGNVEFGGMNPAEIRNMHRVGVGLERMPNRDITARWLDRIAYRIGFTYAATYYRVLGEPIDEWAVTGGMGFPLWADTRLNVGVEYGTRGTTSRGLIKDNILRMNFSVSIGELWFVRHEEE